MEPPPRYDVVCWLTHHTEDDCELTIRTSNGRVFSCEIDPSQFQHSPKVTEQYFKCLNTLRSDEEDSDDDFYVEDACDWLVSSFQPLLTELATAPPQPEATQRPTLSQYLFAPYFKCILEATDDILKPRQRDTENCPWRCDRVRMVDRFFTGLSQWTRSYHPDDVGISYDYPEDVLIRPPTRVIVKGPDGGEVTCFFKSVKLSFGPEHARREVLIHEKIAKARIPPFPETLIGQIYGVVHDGTFIFGMLFEWIDKKEELSKGLAEESSALLKQRWAGQIGRLVGHLHERGIIWGDVKAENVLIDKNDDAWIIDFGGSYTLGWVDKEKAGTLEGDKQGLARIMDILT